MGNSVAAPRNGGRALAVRASALGFAAALAAALAGCGVDYASSASVFPGDFSERHPIQVASAPTAMDVFPVGSGALDPRTTANIRAFAARYRRLGSGEIAILAPSGTSADSRAVREVRAALAASGVRSGVMFGTYAAAERGPAAPIRLSYSGVKAVVPTLCGQWPEDLASGSSIDGWRNEAYSNFGCATQSVIAAQVDDPRDFVTPRALGPSDVAMRTRAIEAVRDAQDPRTKWTQIQTDMDVTPIGGSLTSSGQ